MNIETHIRLFDGLMLTDWDVAQILSELGPEPSYNDLIVWVFRETAKKRAKPKVRVHAGIGGVIDNVSYKISDQISYEVSNHIWKLFVENVAKDPRNSLHKEMRNINGI